MALAHEGYVVLCYVLGSFTALTFAGYALAFGWWWTTRRAGNKDTEGFCTARGTQSFWRIGWSFYAGAVGSWVIVTPSQYASFGGIIGVVVYALSTGMPILMIAFFGGRIVRDLPHVLSLADFIGWRYGPIAKTLVFVITMFTMCIMMLAEYTTIGTLFSDYVGSLNWPIIIVIGVLTLTYTAYGGLAVSIATDQAQGVASFLLALLFAGYVAATYRTPLPSPLPENLGPNVAGYVSIFTLMTSLIASTMMNESFWQRVWASQNRRQLHLGGAVGYVAIVCLVFLSGFGGWLAFAGGYVSDATNANLYLVQILGGRPGGPDGGVATVNSWLGVLVIILAVIMCEGSVDSSQNGMAAALSGQYLKNSPLLWTRVAVVLINIPLVIIATRGFEVLALFLVLNLLSSCAILPVLMGLSERLRPFLTETGFVLGVFGGILGLTATGIGANWDPSNVSGSLSSGAYWAWYGNNYDWRCFLAALGFSAGVDLLWCAGAWLVRRTTGVRGPGISVLMRLPGMKILTASPNWPHDGVHGAGARAAAAINSAAAAADAKAVSPAPATA